LALSNTERLRGFSAQTILRTLDVKRQLAIIHHKFVLGERTVLDTTAVMYYKSNNHRRVKHAVRSDSARDAEG